ncbi:MAG: hypothetical protein ABI862_04100, partial [Ilumatobacteraceae bacterium]
MSDVDPSMAVTPPSGTPAIAAPTGVVAVADPTPVGGIPILPRRRWHRRLGIGVAAIVLVSIGYYAVTLYQVHATGRSDQARPV